MLYYQCWLVLTVSILLGPPCADLSVNEPGRLGALEPCEDSLGGVSTGKGWGTSAERQRPSLRPIHSSVQQGDNEALSLRLRYPDSCEPGLLWSPSVGRARERELNIFELLLCAE